VTDEEMQNTVVQWLSTVAKCTTIREFQSGPIPEYPYVTVRYVSSKEVRQHERDFLYEDDAPSGRVWAAPILEVEYMFSVNGFSSSSPTDLLRPIRSAIKVNQVTEPLMPMFIIHRASEIKNLSEWDSEAWNGQAQMDIFMRGLEADGHLIDVIEQYKFIFSRTSGGV
jgi:hypothetical protein